MLALYLDPVDWGKKTPTKAYVEPSKDKKDDKGLPNEAIPSELQKRILALQQAIDAQPCAEYHLERAQRNRDSIQLVFARNHLEYVRKMEELENAKDPVAVQDLKLDDATGRPALSPAGMTVLKTNGQPEKDKDGKDVIDTSRRIGKPMFQEPLPDVNKSFAVYNEDLAKVMEKILAKSKEIDDWIKKEKKLTVRMTGKRDEMGKLETPGYYDLLEMELVAQKRLKSEIDYVQPLWVRELVNAQLLLERRRGLIKRLQELGVKNLAAAP